MLAHTSLTEGILVQVNGLKYTTVSSTAGQYTSGTFCIQIHLQVLQQETRMTIQTQCT